MSSPTFCPKVCIEKLIESGMNEREITDALRADGVELTAATLNRIKSGGIKRTSFVIGMGLMRLCEKRFGAESVQGATPQTNAA